MVMDVCTCFTEIQIPPCFTVLDVPSSKKLFCNLHPTGNTILHPYLRENIDNGISDCNTPTSDKSHLYNVIKPEMKILTYSFQWNYIGCILSSIISRGRISCNNVSIYPAIPLCGSYTHSKLFRAFPHQLSKMADHFSFGTFSRMLPVIIIDFIIPELNNIN